MAIEVERLLVSVVAQGGDAAAREIRDVGDAGIDSARDITVFSGALDSAEGSALQFSGAMQVVQGRLDAVSDEFSQVRNSAVSAGAGMGSFTGATTAAAGSTQLLQGRVDELEDELEEVRNAAIGATGAMGAYQGATLSSALATYTMHDALIAGAIPSLIVLLSTLGPLVGTVGALALGFLSLASGFGAVMGTGFLAWFQQTEDATEQLEALRDELIEISVAFGQQFIPLIQDAIDATPAFAQSIFDAMGPMEPFVQELRRMGSAAQDVIPQIVSWIMDLGRESIPVWREFTAWVGTAVPNALEFFRSVVSRTWDSLHSLTLALFDALATFTEFGVVATNVVGPMLESILGGFERLLNFVMDLPPPIRDLTVALAALAPVFTIGAVGAAELIRMIKGLSGTFTTSNSIIARMTPTLSTMAKALGVVGVAAAALAVAYDRNFGNIQAATARVADAIRSEFVPVFQLAQSVVSEILGDIAAEFDGMGLAIEGAVGRVFRAVSHTLVAGIRQASSSIQTDLNNIISAWREHHDSVFQNIRNIASMLQGELIAAYQYFQSAAAEAVMLATTTWEGFVASVRQSLPGIISQIRELGNAFISELVPRIENAITVGRRLYNEYGNLETIARQVAISIGVFSAALIGASAPFTTIIGHAVMLGTRISGIIGPIGSLSAAIKTGLVGAFTAAVGAIGRYISSSNRIYAAILKVIGVTKTLAAGFGSGGLMGAVSALAGMLPNLRAGFATLTAPIRNAATTAAQFVMRSTAVQAIVSTLVGLIPNLRTVFSALPGSIQQVIARSQALISRFGLVQAAVMTLISRIPTLRQVFGTLPVAIQQIIARSTTLQTVFGAVQTAAVAIGGRIGVLGGILTQTATYARMVALAFGNAGLGGAATVLIGILTSNLNPALVRIQSLMGTVATAARGLMTAFGMGGVSGTVSMLAGMFPRLSAAMGVARGLLVTLVGIAANVTARLGMGGLSGALTIVGQRMMNLTGLIPGLNGILGQLVMRARDVAFVLGQQGVGAAASYLLGTIPRLSQVFSALSAPIMRAVSTATLFISQYGIVQSTVMALSGIIPRLGAVFGMLPAPIMRAVSTATLFISQYGVVQSTIIALSGIIPRLGAVFGMLPAPIQRVVAQGAQLITRLTSVQGAITLLTGAIPRLRTVLTALPAVMAHVAANGLTLRNRLGAGGLHPAIIKLRNAIPPLRAAFATVPAAMQSIVTAATGLIARLGAAGGVQGVITLLLGSIPRLRTLLASIPGVLTRVTGSATALITRLGAAGLQGVFTALIGLVPRFRTVLASIPGAFQRVAGGALTLISRLGAVGLRGAFLGLVRFIPVVVGAIGTIGPALLGLLGPIGVVIGIAAALYAAWQTNFLGIRDITNQVINGIRTTIEGDMSAVQNTIDVVTQAIHNFWQERILPLWELTKQAFDRIVEVIRQAMSWIMDTIIRPALAGIEDLYQTHGENLLNEIVETYDALKQYITAFWNFIKPIIQGGTEAAIGFWQKWGDEITAIVEFTIDLIGNIIKIGLDAILTFLSFSMNVFQQDWEGAWSDVSGFLSRTWDEIIGFTKEWGGRFLDYLIGLLADIYQGFVDWANDLIFGSLIKDMFNEILSVAETFGTDFLNSISDTVQAVYDEADKKLGELVDRAEELLNGLSSWIRNTWDIASAMKSTFEAAGRSAGQALKRAFNNAVPSSAPIPSVTVAGKTFGGGSLSLPQLQTGGFIEQTGIAMLHEGERVIPESQLDRGGMPEFSITDFGGGRGQTINDIDVEVTIEGDADRRDVEEGVDGGLSDALKAHNVRR